MRMSKKTIMFTDDLVKLLRYNGKSMTFYRDKDCQWLYVGVSEYGKRSFYFISEDGSRLKKIIGDVFEINLAQARKIALNIAENFNEFRTLKLAGRVPLCRDFAQNGFLPRKQPELENSAYNFNLEYQQKLKAQNEKLVELVKAIDNRVKRFSDRLSAILDDYKVL